MAVLTIKANINCNVERVWDTVTSLKHCKWRSDLSKIEVLSEKQFIEYTQKGYTTTFTITASEPYRRWEFDMENENIKGHWIGIFIQNGDQTEIEFTENISVKKILMRPFVKSYLKKQQASYISDLKKALL